MRKSSMSNRNSNILLNERRSRGRSTDGARNTLLQPGFASKHRRSSSAENRDSGVGLLSRKSHLPVRRSRSQLSLQSIVTPRRETISPGSLRTTPNDCLKQSSKAVTGTLQKCRRDNRNFGDRAVFSAAITQVSNYFAQHGRVLNLRQALTMKIFVDSTSFLLTQLGVPVNLTTANYLEEIPYAMRLLQYPGSLATSWLKTAYVQHSLQHVVAMLSWLVDLLESASFELFEDAKTDEECGFRLLPAKDYMDFFVTAHMHWNSFQPEEEAIEDFKDKLTQACLPDGGETGKAALQTEIESLSAKCRHDEEITKKKNDLEEMLHVLQSDIANLKTHLKNTDKFLSKLDDKIESLDRKKGDTEGKIISIQCLTEKLRKQVAGQEMSVDDFNELLEKCEHLRGRIRSGETCISELQEMAFTSDRQIVQTRAEFNKRMEHFNKLLVMEACSIPQLSQLQIRSNVLAETYKEETEEVDKTLSALNKDLFAARSEAQEVLADIKSQVDEMTQSVNCLRQEVTTMKDKNCQLENSIAELKVTMQRDESKMREEEKQLQDEINKNLNNEEIVALKEKLVMLQAKQKDWAVALEKLKEKTRRFLEESVKITQWFAAEVQNLRTQTDERLKKLIEQKKAQIRSKHA